MRAKIPTPRISVVEPKNLKLVLLGIAVAYCLSGPVLADAPVVSLIPKPRPAAVGISGTVVKAIVADQGRGGGVRVSLVPRPRPAKLHLSAVQPPKKKFRRKGSVCGVRAIRGATLKGFSAKTVGCGIKNPVRVTSVAGIKLSTAATIDCSTAKALHKWVVNAAEPVFRSHGGGLNALRVAASYSCRTRNSRKGAKISEHAKGHAIDISGFGLRNGASITVLKDWNSARYGSKLKRLHKSACGAFGTVLGPRSDVHHRDHFHFDTARYRSGAYCR